MIPTADFITLLEAHDWYFERSDDSRAYSRGLKERNRLLFLCLEQPELFRLYNHADNCIINGSPFNFPSVTGTTQVKDEKQHNIQHINSMGTITLTLDPAALTAINNLTA